MGLRIEPMMGSYVAQKLRAETAVAFPVMGGDARTGIPERAMIDPREFLA